MLRRRLEPLGIRLMSLLEGEQTGLSYDVHAVVADYDKRQFLKISADGMNRAARDGRYCGGIVPIGFVVDGKKPNPRLVPSDKPIWSDWTETALIRHIFNRLAVDDFDHRQHRRKTKHSRYPYRLLQVRPHGKGGSTEAAYTGSLAFRSDQEPGG